MVTNNPAQRLVALALAVGVAILPASAHAQDPVPASEPPPPPTTAETTAPAPSGVALSGDDEYARFVAAMPSDYDINYTYIAPAKGSAGTATPDRPASPSKANARALGITGGTFLTLGGVLGISALGLGLGAKGDGDLETAAIGTGASGGALLLLGTGLLLGKRSVRRKNGELPEKPLLSESQRKSAVLLGSISAVFGVGGIAGGAVLLAKDEDSKGGATLVAFGVIFTGLALWPIGRLLADKARRNRTVRVSPVPMMVRQGAALGIAGRF